MDEIDMKYLSNIATLAAAGDVNAFAEMYAATYQKQYLFALSVLENEKKAREVLLDTYIQAHRHLKELSDMRLVISWLGQQNLRACYKWQEKDDRIPAEIMALPFSESQAVFLNQYRGMSVKEIARMMNIDTRMAREYLSSGLRRVPNLQPTMKKPDMYYLPLENNRAQKILDMVFETEECMPCVIPMDKLTTYAHYRTDRYKFQRNVVGGLMGIFLVLPIFFMTPHVTLTPQTGNTETYSLEVRSLLPVREVNVSIDGVRIPVYETGANTYEIEPQVNGTMTVKATLINDQSTEVSTQIVNFDDVDPHLESTYVSDGLVHLLLADDDSGLDFTRICGLKGDSTIYPVFVDEELGEVVFQADNLPEKVVVYDKAGNGICLVLHVK
ncbi:MAG: hypothetical protein HUJ69_02220 [Lachnospiraceae bacterium]|nr:hypothetical protein [Lachnospiraceae bacterium]